MCTSRPCTSNLRPAASEPLALFLARLASGPWTVHGGPPRLFSSGAVASSHSPRHGPVGIGVDWHWHTSRGAKAVTCDWLGHTGDRQDNKTHGDTTCTSYRIVLLEIVFFLLVYNYTPSYPLLSFTSPSIRPGSRPPRPPPRVTQSFFTPPLSTKSFYLATRPTHSL